MNYIFIIIFSVFIGMHPIHSVLNINIKYLYIFFTFYLISFSIFKFNNKIFDPNILKIGISGSSILIVFGLLGTLFSMNFHQIFSVLTLAFIICVFGFISSVDKIDKIFFFILFKLNIIILVGAWVGFFYALAGGNYLVIVSHPETNTPIYFYPFTFSNSVLGNFIRPSGLFDEPGALAFFNILSAVILNHEGWGKLDKSKYILWILGGSLITFSLMSYLALVLYLIFENRKKMIKFASILMIILLIPVIYIYSTYPELFDLLILDRFKFTDGRFEGDNRSDQVELVINYMDFNIFLKGYQTIYGDFNGGDAASSNPFSILFTSGIFVYIPFILICLSLVVKTLLNNVRYAFGCLIFLALLLQRPYIYSLYWSSFIGIVLLFIFGLSLKNFK